MRLLVTLAIGLAGLAPLPLGGVEFLKVGDDGNGFVGADTGKGFRPWGVNYDHDADGRLIEDYWHDQWSTVEEDFAEIKALGANVVRVHLQLGKFMKSAEEPEARELARLGDLLKLAERTGLYLDLTGLGCYHKADVPAWYDKLEEGARWKVQARFWSAIAERCADSPAVFCYDLMNEPACPERRETMSGCSGNSAGNSLSSGSRWN